MSQNLVEKIVQRFVVNENDTKNSKKEIRADDFVAIRPKHVMTHDNTAPVIPKFTQMGASRIFDPSQPVFALDHDVQNSSAENLAKYAKIKQFAEQHSLAFYPAGSGIAHQVIMEEGFVLPGTLVVGSDSHSNIYGALNCLGTPVVRTDAAAIWATGQTWWQVPPSVKVTLQGRLAEGVTGKDVILTLIGLYQADEVLNYAVEFVGDGVASLTMSQRMTIANMTTEWGALVGIFPYDAVTRNYLLQQADYFQKRGDTQPRLIPTIIEQLENNLPTADSDAHYIKEIVLDLAQVAPIVSGPNEVKTTLLLPEIAQRNLAIDKAYLLSCVNSRLEDIAEAANIMQGRKVASGVKFYLAAASANVERQARQLGYWDTLLEAGAIALPAGCGPCIGLGEGVLESGEVAISATNRNFKGRMGSSEAQVYLSSPAIVAASAIAGKIAVPSERAYATNQLVANIKINSATLLPNAKVEILDGFPTEIVGQLLFVPKNNLNTDGIYGKEYTYQDNVAPEVMARVAMQHYDPNFQQIAQVGDILVGGWNFGTGSSREQAATCLKYRGIQMLIAGSYSQTFKRNAFNNGYIVIECPALLEWLQQAFVGNKSLTIRTNLEAKIDFQQAIILCDNQQFHFSPLGNIAQQLVILNGFENLILQQLNKFNT